jgi:tetratricopeptide (TPR) repeat protein
MKTYLIIFSIFLLFVSSNVSASEGNRLALLIGNSNYKYAGNLDNPINDVRAIKKVLEQLGFTVLKYEDCSQNTMKRAIDKFGRQLKTKDVGLFFYAGHGVQVDGYNYLLPINAKLENENDAEYDCVRAGRILAKMESAGSKTNIVILDACRANPFERAWRRGEKGSGLAFMNAPSGSLIAYSTAPGKTALDGGGKNSPYTTAILQHIDEPNITVLQMFQRVRSTVMRLSLNKQIPWESTSLSGDFYFHIEDVITVKQPNALSTPSKPHMPVNKNHFLNQIDIQTEAIKWNPKNASAYTRRGIAYAKLKQYTESINDFTKVIEWHPNLPSSYYHRGLSFYHLEHYESSIQDFTETIRLNPNHESSYFVRGGAYGKLEQYTKAIHDFTKAIALNPQDTKVYYVRGFAYYKLKQYTKAIKDYTTTIVLDPKHVDAYIDRANAYGKLKQYTKAIQDYTQLIRLNPNDLKAYIYRGISYYRLGEYTKAIPDCTKAISFDPKNVDAYYYRGLSYYKLSNNSLACSDGHQACAYGDCSAVEFMRAQGVCN